MILSKEIIRKCEFKKQRIGYKHKNNSAILYTDEEIKLFSMEIEKLLHEKTNYITTNSN